MSEVIQRSGAGDASPVQDNNDWLRKLVAYISHWLAAGGLATAPVPVDWVNGPHSAIHGSPNQKWLQVAAGLLTGDSWWIDFSLQRYQNEFRVGHQEAETLTGSHAWQHLTAHAAIRYALRTNKPLAGQIGKDRLARLQACNDIWWGNEAWLMQQFYSYAAKGCVSVGARDQPPGWPRSSQKDAFAAWIVGAAKRFPLPRHLDATDVYCQVLGDKLVALGDDLGRGKRAEPKLWSPVYALRHGDDVSSYWTPDPAILGPSYYAETVAGKPAYKFQPAIPENHAEYRGLGISSAQPPAQAAQTAPVPQAAGAAAADPGA